MGGVPKCLMSLDGTPLLRRHLQAMCEAGVEEIIVVTGHYHAQIEPVLADFPVTVVRNPEPAAGQPSSVRLGIEALGTELDLVMVMLADQPLVGRAELTELTSAFCHRHPGTRILYPSVRGQRGNPVLFAGDLVAEMRNAGTKIVGRGYIDRHPQEVHVHVTESEAFIIDLDTQEDLADFERRTGHTLVLPGA